MEFVIYDHQCPVATTDYFTEVIPWVSVILSLYVMTKFVVKLIDTSFEVQVDNMNTKLIALEQENDDLIAKVETLEKEREHMDEVVKALVDKFVKEGHPLTKVD